jgi:hypothetical protein
MSETHITCHLCPASMSLRFYQDEKNLSNHITNAHFICKRCERNGVLEAFNSHGEYVGHMLTIHHEKVNQTAVFFNTHHNFPVRFVDFQSLSSRPNQSSAHAHHLPATSSCPPATIPAYLDIPTNMRISGRVTGTGNFCRDETDESLQAYFDELNGGTSSSTRARKVAGVLSGQAANELFPPLASESSSKAKANSSTSSSTYHPMSIVPTIQQQESKRQQELLIEIQRQEELEQRRLKRHEMLAEAFEIASTASSMRQLVLDMGLSKNYADVTSTQQYIEVLSMPLYPTAALDWSRANENMKELLGIEKKLVELLGNKSMESIQLKTGMNPAARSIAQLLSKYYLVNSYEYSSPRGKYISLGKYLILLSIFAFADDVFC